MKCKVINSSKNDLEKVTNDWLSTGKYEIIEIKQTQVDTYITLTIFYLDKNETRSKKIEKINKKVNNN